MFSLDSMAPATGRVEGGPDGTLRAFCVRCGRERSTDPVVLRGELAACLCGEQITYYSFEIAPAAAGVASQEV